MAAAKKERYIKVTEQITKLGISPVLQMMYAEIVHLSEGKGYCYANNKHFELLLSKSDSCIKRYISTLEDKELVFRLVIRSVSGTERRLYIEKDKFEKDSEAHQEQSLTGRQNGTPGVSEVNGGGGQICTPGVVKSEHPGVQEWTPGVAKSDHHNIHTNNTYNNTVEYIPTTDVVGDPRAQEDDFLPDQQKKEEKEKASAQKEKEEELSARARELMYLDTWWEFYKQQNNGEEPPHGWRNHYRMGAPLKKIQQDLAAVFGDDEESGYQEFVSILQSWPKLRDYHRLQVEPKLIHKNLVEIRKYLRETGGNVASIPYVNQAVSLYKDVFHELKGFPPNINGKAQQHVSGTLTYLLDLHPGNTWEAALKGFELILRAWPEIEKQDKFYSDNFTLSYIHGNTSKIIGIIKSRGAKQAELTTEAAESWLERNGFS